MKPHPKSNAIIFKVMSFRNKVPQTQQQTEKGQHQKELKEKAAAEKAKLKAENKVKTKDDNVNKKKVDKESDANKKGKGRVSDFIACLRKDENDVGDNETPGVHDKETPGISKTQKVSAITPKITQTKTVSAITPEISQTKTVSAVTPEISQTKTVSAVTPEISQTKTVSAISPDISKTVSAIDTAGEEHKLPIVAYGNKRKFKDYKHSREYGVVYNRDVEAYNYRGYDINPPNVERQGLQGYEVQKQPTKWVQYISHAELHRRRLPFRMNYVPEDNSFIQLVLILNLIALMFTLFSTITVKYIAVIHRLLIYDIIWVPGFFGVMFSVYMLLCSSSSRKFPCNYVLLILNILSMTYMCCYVTAYQDTFALIITIIAICFVNLIFLLMALCDVDFRKLTMLLLAALLGLLVPFIILVCLKSFKRTMSWVPRKQRHLNMIVFGISTHCTSMILMIQLMIENRTILMPEEDFATGTFVVYQCEICMFMKLVSYMGLFEENHY